MLGLAKKISKVGLRGDHAKAIRRLTLLAMIPTLNGDKGRIMILYYLGHRCYVAQRYDEAITWFGRLLAVPTLPPHLKTLAHRESGECCEALGKPEEAEQHRNQSRASAKFSPYNYAAIQTRAAEYERESQFEEAYKVYRESLDYVPLTPSQTQSLHAKMAVSAQRMGAMDLCIQAAEIAIADNTSTTITASMHRLAGLSYSNLGDLDKAEGHAKSAEALANQAGDKANAAEALAILSGVARQKGHLSESLAMGERSVTIHTPPTRVCSIYLFETLMDLGRYEDAWASMTGTRENILFNPKAQRTTAAIDVLCQARVCLETEKFRDALDFWNEGLANFINDKKMERYCSCVGMAIKAHLGLAEEIRPSIRPMQEDIHTSSVGRGNKLDYYGYLIRATSVIDDHETCMDLLADFRSLAPHPGTLPKPLYYAAESCRKAAETDDAIALFREAASASPEAIYAQRARQRLTDFGTD